MNKQNLTNYLIKNKEVYHLWFEYLKENEPYKVLCQWYRDNTEIFLNPYLWRDDDIPEELRKCPYFYDLTGQSKFTLYSTYRHWAAVHKDSWERIFTNFQERITAHNSIKEHMLSSFPANKNSIVSLIDAYIKKNLEQTNTIPPLLKFREICYLIEEADNCIPKVSRSLPQKEIVSLWKNLEIWRAVKRDGLTLDDAIEKIDSGKKVHTGQTVSVYRSWSRDLAYAGRIIENAGRGLFPGPYKNGVKAR
jgi:hypothetical protein